MNQDADRLRQKILQAVNILFDSGVMQHSGHGNLSARVGNNRMVLTGRGRIRDLTAGDLAIVAFDGQVLEGSIEPENAEIVPMHTAIYHMRQEVGAIIHTHSPAVTAFAVAHVPLPSDCEPLLRLRVAEPIPVVSWAPRGSDESVANIVQQLEARPHIQAVLLANHGLLALGADPIAAAQLIVAMEETAEATLGARSLGGEKPFPPDALKREEDRMAAFASI